MCVCVCVCVCFKPRYEGSIFSYIIISHYQNQRNKKYISNGM